MWLFAQIMDSTVETAAHPIPTWVLVILEIVGPLVSLAYFAFFVWMMIHCYRNEPDRQFWLWMMILAQGIGPAAYFVIRYLPSTEFPAPAFMRRWTRGRQIARLEAAAEQIGNPYQFIQWGDALREVGDLDQAKSAFERALKKEPDNLQALWGAARVASQQKRLADVLTITQRILDKDPKYKFGDVSLVHGRALNDLGQYQAARTHFEQHTRSWRHPEAMYLLAKLCAGQGDNAAARHNLKELIQDLNACPAAIARKSGRWKSLARQLLRKLPS